MDAEAKTADTVDRQREFRALFADEGIEVTELADVIEVKGTSIIFFCSLLPGSAQADSGID
jgi:hypothetical protein